MTLWLKQSTAVTIKLGPFVDDTDGKTAETGLTISQADIRLSKNGGDIAQTHNSAGATHDELGLYDVPLDTTDTNTLGTLRVAVHESGALPVWQDFMVVPANVWDSFFASDRLQVHAAEIEAGLITAAAIATGAIDADALAADAVTEIQSGLATAAALDAVDNLVDTEVAAILADTNELQTDWVNGGRLDLLIDAIKAKTDNLPADPADDSDLDTQLAAIAGYLDTEVAAIKAKTDNLPASPAAVGSAMTLQAGHGLATAAALDTVDNFLDTEVAAIKAVTDDLAGMLETDGAVKRFTANALEQGPAGEAGAAPTVEEIRAELDANSTRLAAILADTNELQAEWADGGRLDLILDSLTAGAGSGAVETTVVVDDGTDPLDGVAVWVTTDSLGANVIASGTTNASGTVVFHLDAGSYYVWKALGGYNFTNPETLVVS